MPKRSRRADEVIPKLHYRPGVEDADLEATIVGFYGIRTAEEDVSPSEPIENEVFDKATPAIQTPPVITGVDITGDNSTPVKQETTPVATTSIDPTPHITPPVAMPSPRSKVPVLQSAGDILRELPPETIRSPLLSTPDRTTPAITTPLELIRASLPATTPDITTPDITTSVISQTRPYNVHRAVLAQDGHSHTEQLLYDILWRSGKGGPGDAYRAVQIPQSELAGAVRMTTKNLRIALDRLVEKLAIEEVRSFDRGTRIARTWKVYSYKLILERRKAAGMEWVIRDRGVRFVDPSTIPVKPTRVVMLETDIPTCVKSIETTPVAATATTPVKTTSPLLGQISSKEDRQSSTDAAPAPSLVASAITAAFGFIDDEALKTLAKKCRENTPDATDEEIAELGAMTARRISRMRSVDNHVGLLITQTANCFKGEPFAIYRREKEERERRFAAEFPDDQG